MSETTFENAVVGDEVESLRFGKGKIVDIFYCGDGKEYPIRVSFMRYTISFTKEGKAYLEDKTPDLYWPGVKVIAPERPKRRVTKTVEMWTNIYPDYKSCAHDTEYIANNMAADNRIACVKLTGTYEVEE